MVYYNPYITGEYNPLSNLNNQGYFIAQLVIAIFQTLHDRFMNLKRLASCQLVKTQVPQEKQAHWLLFIEMDRFTWWGNVQKTPEI